MTATMGIVGQLRNLCTRIGDDAADEDGFVPIRELLRRFRIGLTSRPLLVEAMLATISDPSDAAAAKWLVLIDSETHPFISDDSLRMESSSSALPARARNTIAHELTHSLAFRPSQFGLQFSHSKKGDLTSSEFVKAVERDTERLSPLLLFPEKTLKSFLQENPTELSLRALLDLRQKLGISRPVLVNRLKLLLEEDERGLLTRQPLRNVAIGCVEWATTGPLFRSWPLFVRFERNVVPDILWRLLKQDRLSLSDLNIPATVSYEPVPFECDARVAGTSRADRNIIQVEIEPRRSSGTGLFVLRKAADGAVADPVQEH